MGRILWRFSNSRREAEIFVITEVNYGDRPAGCIAIAAIRETAEKFGEGEEGPWFLRNRTYVDDATGAAHDQEHALWISLDMESITENEGFEFKGTVMTRDQLDETGELCKVLGLRWDTENDDICIDINPKPCGYIN